MYSLESIPWLHKRLKIRALSFPDASSFKKNSAEYYRNDDILNLRCPLIRGESDRLEEGGQVQLALTLPGPSQLDILTALQTRR
jgi:hypothetical protein